MRSPVLRFWRRRSTTDQPIARPDCAADCPLAACPAGCRATVVGIDCLPEDAWRLRTLGVFVGARVGIVDTRSGILLDVRGSRLALDPALARAITVRMAAA